jgi:glycosyltransferase involved in cell wall biosynthesis
MTPDTLVIITARNEADRIEATLLALARAFPDARVYVADDGSTDATPEIAERAGARVLRGEQALGKGAAATRAARRALGAAAPDAVVVLCDGDLGDSAASLRPLCEAVRDGSGDLAVAAFSRRVGGGFGVALRFASWAIRRRCGMRTRGCSRLRTASAWRWG